MKLIKLQPNCLALQYNCSKQLARHKSIIKQYNCTDKHEHYMIHVSLSYKIPSNFDTSHIDVSDIGRLHITHEHASTLQTTPYHGKYK